MIIEKDHVYILQPKDKVDKTHAVHIKEVNPESFTLVACSYINNRFEDTKTRAFVVNFDNKRIDHYEWTDFGKFVSLSAVHSAWSFIDQKYKISPLLRF